MWRIAISGRLVRPPSQWKKANWVLGSMPVILAKVESKVRRIEVQVSEGIKQDLFQE
jgi:hypothetical protein